MEIIPAIDILDGKCVRLHQGRFDQVTVYFDDPADAAKMWTDQGATRIHVVDLKGSVVGEPQEITSLERILAATDVPVQVGGGIRTLETAIRLLNFGVERVIVGTSAVLDSGLARELFQALGEKVVLAIDARGGKVALKGWLETTAEDAADFARRMEKLGAPRIIYTDISRDGTLAGANIPSIRLMAEALSIPVIASGGITTVNDIIALKELEPLGVEGAILGKALYSGELKFSDAVAAAS
nr:1-(5-phosphoribosyl)-5-[(5-phosphoribosylamino)methylideneamino]imidazole-4-carboxamide isomerase [Armatimonadota bacterium]